MRIGRRKFILKLFLGLTGMAGLLFLNGFWFERYIIDWTSFDVDEEQNNKIKLIQLSDLHLNEIKSYHKSIANKINKEKPDAIVFTGDTVSRKNKLPILKELLNLLDRNILKIVILGNKEYSSRMSITDFTQLFQEYNGHILVNENYRLEKNNRTVNLLGIDDFMGGNSDYKKACENIDKTLETIVLNHCPEYRDSIDSINKTEKVNIKLILSGHTHGGQITFFGKELFKPGGSGRYLKGWYENDQTTMYVSKGVGTTILPIRFGARAEASIFYI
ncbi:metallophosphoesterase [Maribacter aestuarii]|uniref:metallophosphoesterase n=1 Tax=Maribacter aestuarii TaxID=1130723 RepID=UPI00248CE35C|nr:metallophosphoesterase [Maribacter aestuarii]